MESQKSESKGPGIKARLKSETPVFFRKLQVAGLAITAIGGAIVGAPVALPVLLITIGGYMVVGGGVLTAVSQLTIKTEH